MKCPLLAIAKPTEVERESPSLVDCMRENCAWWNDWFGMCCIAVEAHLKATEDRMAERRMARGVEL